MYSASGIFDKGMTQLYNKTMQANFKLSGSMPSANPSMYQSHTTGIGSYD